MHCYLGSVRRVSDSEISSFLQASFATGMHDIQVALILFLMWSLFFYLFLSNRYNLFVLSFGFLFIPIIKVVFGLPTASFQLLWGFGCYLFIFISVVGSLEFIYSKWSIRLYFVGWLCMRPTHTPALISTWCASEEPGESWTLRTSQSGSMKQKRLRLQAKLPNPVFVHQQAISEEA